jgi:hypothetical protein
MAYRMVGRNFGAAFGLGLVVRGPAGPGRGSGLGLRPARDEPVLLMMMTMLMRLPISLRLATAQRCAVAAFSWRRLAPPGPTPGDIVQALPYRLPLSHLRPKNFGLKNYPKMEYRGGVYVPPRTILSRPAVPGSGSHAPRTGIGSPCSSMGESGCGGGSSSL